MQTATFRLWHSNDFYHPRTFSIHKIKLERKRYRHTHSTCACDITHIETNKFIRRNNGQKANANDIALISLNACLFYFIQQTIIITFSICHFCCCCSCCYCRLPAIWKFCLSLFLNLYYSIIIFSQVSSLMISMRAILFRTFERSLVRSLAHTHRRNIWHNTN